MLIVDSILTVASRHARHYRTQTKHTVLRVRLCWRQRRCHGRWSCQVGDDMKMAFTKKLKTFISEIRVQFTSLSSDTKCSKLWLSCVFHTLQTATLINLPVLWNVIYFYLFTFLSWFHACDSATLIYIDGKRTCERRLGTWQWISDVFVIDHIQIIFPTSWSKLKLENSCCLTPLALGNPPPYDMIRIMMPYVKSRPLSIDILQ